MPQIQRATPHGMHAVAYRHSSFLAHQAALRSALLFLSPLLSPFIRTPLSPHAPRVSLSLVTINAPVCRVSTTSSPVRHIGRNAAEPPLALCRFVRFVPRLALCQLLVPQGVHSRLPRLVLHAADGPVVTAQSNNQQQPATTNRQTHNHGKAAGELTSAGPHPPPPAGPLPLARAPALAHLVPPRTGHVRQTTTEQLAPDKKRHSRRAAHTQISARQARSISRSLVHQARMPLAGRMPLVARAQPPRGIEGFKHYLRLVCERPWSRRWSFDMARAWSRVAERSTLVRFRRRSSCRARATLVVASRSSA
jgi:hypothetical protein